MVPDPARRLPGRGAHIHSDPGCLTQAKRRRAFARALRIPASPDVAALEAHVARATDKASRNIDGGESPSPPATAR